MRRLKGAGVVLLIAACGACYSWKPVSLAPAPQSQPAVLDARVTLQNGKEIRMSEARVIGDSVVGRSDHVAVAFPVSNVQLLEKRHDEATKTIFALLGLLLVGAAAYVGYSVATME